MKVLIAAILFTFFTPMLNAGELPSYSDNLLKREINRMIAYPSNLKSHNATEVVMVAFRIEPCGTISIDEVNASRADFAQYVVEKLNTMRFESGSGEQMCMRFTFKKQ
ncbi:MAG: hypothetical protein GC193_08535 [Cryomorphaceae bacterium]|nr:hypothetical protein [Cryomorphaceae bacterium]